MYLIRYTTYLIRYIFVLPNSSWTHDDPTKIRVFPQQMREFLLELWQLTSTLALAWVMQIFKNFNRYSKLGVYLGPNFGHR